MDINEKMSLYIDNLLDENDKEEFEQHLLECAKCKEDYDYIVAHINECKNIKDAVLPANFNDELHNKLIQVKGNKRFNKYNWKAFSIAAAVILVMIASVVQGQYIGNQNQTGQIAQDQNLESGGANESLDYKAEESEKPEMDIANTRNIAEENAPQTTSRILTENEDAIAMSGAGEANQSLTVNEQPKEDSLGITSLSDSEQIDFSIHKSYEAHVHIQNDSLEEITTYIKGYTEDMDSITIHTESDITSEKPEITLKMSSDAFQNCLDYIAQYENVSDYYVDTIDLTEQKDNDNNTVMQETDQQIKNALIFIEITKE